MIEVSEIRFHLGTHADQHSGLLGYLTFTVNGALRLDGVTLRRTQEGKLSLSYPGRTDRQGRERASIKPINDQSRREIETQVLAQLPFQTQKEG